MKKVLISLVILICISIKGYSYGVLLDSPQWPDGYQETITVAAGCDYIMYSIFVDHAAGYISHDGGLSDYLLNEYGTSQKYGDYYGSWLQVTLTACNLQNEEGFARVVAWWNGI